ncbi:MAG: hypothetical protein ACI311_06760 [Bacilli bacterium]
MEEVKTTVAKTTTKAEAVSALKEFKKFNDLTIEEIKTLPIVTCDLVKQLRNSKAKTNSNLSKDFTYFAFIHLIKGLVDVRISLSQAEFLHIKNSAKILGDFTNMTIRIPVRFSKGKKKASEESYYLAEIFFDSKVRRSYFFGDLDIDNLRALGHDELFVLRPELADEDYCEVATIFQD